MSDTDFTARVTRIKADWLNDLNQLRYGNSSLTRGAQLLEFMPTGPSPVARSVREELDDMQVVSALRKMSEVQRNDVLGRVGTSDVSSPIQQVIDYAMTKRCIVDGVPGTYLLGSTITCSSRDVVLRGRGVGTIFKRTGDYGDTFVFTGDDAAGTLLHKCGISDLTIATQGLMSHGANVRMKGVNDFVCENVISEDGFIDFHFSSAQKSHYNNIRVNHTNLFGGSIVGRSCFLFDAAPATYAHPSCADVFINGFNVKQPSAATAYYEHAVKVECSDGVWIQNGHLTGGGTATIGIYGTNATNATSGLLLDNIEMDVLCTNATGILYSGTANSIFGGHLSGIRMNCANSARHGLLVEASVDLDDMTAEGLFIHFAKREGARLLSGRNYRLNVLVVRGCSQETSNTYSGIYLENVTGCQFSGGASGEDPLGSNETLTQKFGIELGSGNSDIRGGLDLEGNLSGSIGGTGAADYTWEDGGLELTPALKTGGNIIPYGGIRFTGGAYLDTNALGGIADSKKFTLVMRVKFDNAASVAEILLDASGTSVSLQRTNTGNLTVQAQNAAAAVILNQTLVGALLSAAGYYTIMISTDMATPGSYRCYVNDSTGTITSTTFTDDTIDLTPAEYALAASTGGTFPFTGNMYMLWFAEGVYTDFSVVANRRKWFSKRGTLADLGAKGEKPTGSQPRVFHCYDDAASWPTQRGTAAGTWTVNGTPTVVNAEDYTYDKNLLHAITTTAAAHKVGRFIQTLTANRGGTTTLDLTYAAANHVAGFQITIRTIQAQTVVSGASDVVPLAGGAAGTAILAATAGKFAVLELNSDNATWTIIQAN